MSWWLGEMVPLDTETTGVDVERDRIVTATLAHIRPGADTDVRSHLIAVDVPIPQAATDVHGITNEKALANGQPPGVVLEEIAGHLAESQANGSPIVGMNAAYDLTILDRELRRNGLRTVEQRLGRPLGPVVDILVIDKHLDRYRPGGRKLIDLCATYGARHDGAHDATEDALAAARVAYKIGQRSTLDVGALRDLYGDRPRQAPHIAAAFAMFGQMSLADLHRAQIGWYAEQAEGLAAYFRKQANEAQHRAEITTDDAERATAEQDAETLFARAESVCPEWPMRLWSGDGETSVAVAA